MSTDKKTLGVNSKYILFGVKAVFGVMFAYSSYKKLKETLCVNTTKKVKSFKIVPGKGILGTVTILQKEQRS
jgi:hypothetical protein